MAATRLTSLDSGEGASSPAQCTVRYGGRARYARAQCRRMARTARKSEWAQVACVGNTVCVRVRRGISEFGLLWSTLWLDPFTLIALWYLQQVGSSVHCVFSVQSVQYRANIVVRILVDQCLQLGTRCDVGRDTKDANLLEARRAEKLDALRYYSRHWHLLSCSDVR